jgi:hypothetical protein
MASSGKRPFWAHQGAEYLIGIVFVAQGLQSTTPMVPTLLGGAVVLNTACAKGPLAAFQVFGRRVHRALDAVLILAVTVGAVQQAVSIDAGTRLIMGLLAFALAFIWILSDFTEKVKVPRAARVAAPTSTAGATQQIPGARATRPAQAAQTSATDGGVAASVGRTAGRLVGSGMNAYRKRKQ